MPHIIISYRKKNPIYGLDYDLVQYALHVYYFYGLAFVVGVLIAILIIIREKRRLDKLASDKLASDKLASDKLAELRGGFYDSKDEKIIKYFRTLHAIAYLQFLANPVVCLTPGYHEVVDPKIFQILLSIIGENVVGPNGIYEPRVISPGIWIMAYVVNRLKKPTLKKIGIDAAVSVVKTSVLEKYKKTPALDHIRAVIRTLSLQVILNLNATLITNIVSRIFINLSPDLSLGIFILNIVGFLSFGIGIGTLGIAGIGHVAGFQVLIFEQVLIKLLSASVATMILAGATRPVFCNQLLRPLPSSPTHSEYLLPVPTTAPRNDREVLKDKMVVYARKANEPEKALYINIPEQPDILCENKAFLKTMEGQILEASDLMDQASIPTPIQEQCTKLPGTSIQVTGGIKTRSDVKQHDERLVREETDRSLTLLEVKGILEDGNWYGAETQLTVPIVNDQAPPKQVPKVPRPPRLRGSNPQRRKQTMTIRDLPKDDLEENCFVQEDTQRVSKLAEKAEKISHQDNYDDDFLI